MRIMGLDYGSKNSRGGSQRRLGLLRRESVSRKSEE